MQETGSYDGQLPIIEKQAHKFKRHNTTCATYEEIEGSESEEDLDQEDAMLCFMAFEEDSNKGDE